MDQDLVQYLDGRFQAIDVRFESMDRRFETLEQRFEQRFEEVKRHTGVLVEDLRYQVRLVAEGFATFVEGRYAQDQARIDERFRETQTLIRSSYDHLQQQQDHLRQSQDQIQQRVESIERNQN
jgi:hypothetical protein